MTKELLQKMLEHTIMLYKKTITDELMFGDRYVEFSERGLEIIDPLQIKSRYKI